MKRLLSCVLIVALVLTYSPAISISAQEIEKTDFALEGYIAISTKAELNSIRNNLNGNYYLTKDIVFTEADYLDGGTFYNDGNGWNPIGTKEKPFRGVLNGNGHTITGLYTKGSSYAGLFAYLSGTIENLTLRDVSVSGTQRSGAFAGSTIDSASFTNCAVYGSVTTTGWSYTPAVGGLVGMCGGDINDYYNKVRFKNCQNYATVISTSSDSIAGGIYGWGYLQTIVVEDSSNHGNITGEDDAGGIAGQTGECSTTTRCYNTGTIIGQAASNQFNCVGGIVGCGDGWSSSRSKITNCYNAGVVKSVTTTSSLQGYVGGISGATHEITIENCYNVGKLMHNDREGTNTYSHINGICNDTTTGTDQVFLNNYTIAPYYISRYYGSDSNKSDALMQQADTYQGFDFWNIWFIDTNTDYPYPQLRSNVQASIESIKVETQPSTNMFIEGRQPDLSGATARITYKSGEETIVDITENMLADLDYCKPGSQSVHIRYAGIISENTIDFQVISKNIELTSLPKKLTYLECKDVLDMSGTKLMVTYGDGTTEELDVTESMVSGFNNNVVGPQTLTVHYEEKEITFAIEILAKSLAAIRLSTLPLKLTYVQGQPLDFDGGVLELLYDNDQTEKKAMTVAEIHIDPNALGITPVIVSYGGMHTSYDVTVNERVITSLQVTAPQKVTYYQGDVLDLSGCKLSVLYESDDAYSEEVIVSPDMLSGYDMNVPMHQTVVVNYNGHSTSFEINVLPNIVEEIEIISLPNTLRYQLQADSLDLTGGVLKVTYSNGETTEISMAEASVNGFNNTQAGTQTLTVIYAGKETTFNVEIVRREPSTITILNMPEKIEYLQLLDELDLTGGLIQVDYTIGPSENFPLSAAEITGFDNSCIGTNTLTATLGNAQTTFKIKIVANNTTEFAGGAGTEQHPYLVSTKAHLNNVRNYLDAHYLMLNDIRISDDDYQEGGIFYNNGAGWAPIGGNSSFTGVFDGNGFAIDNLFINLDCANVQSVGLFATNNGIIQNLTIRSGSISVVEKTNRISVGAVVGTNQGIIDNCHNMISVYALSTTFTSRVSRAGGVIGYNYTIRGTVIVKNCSNSGEISAYAVDNYAYAGGIVGESYADGSAATIIIEKCYNSGLISSGAEYSYSGGIVGENGQNYSQNAIVRKCGNVGSIVAGIKYQSGGHAGGIVGFNGGYISECYNTADVTAYLTDAFDSAYAGGIAGSNRSPNSGAVNIIEDCFNSGNITAIKKASYGNYAFAGGITGCQSFATNYPGKTRRCYNLGLVSSNQEEFGPITSVINGGTVNSCYHLDNMQSVFNTETSCSQSEMMQMETFVGFDFTNVWTMDGNSDYPYPELKEVQLREKLSSVEIVSMPSKQTYYVNETIFDPTGGKLSLTYNTMRTETIDMTLDVVKTFDCSEVGIQTVTISIDNVEVTFDIEVKFATITFLNEDGTVLHESKYAYGEEVTVPADPTKNADNICTYVFAGWDKEVVACVGDATYTATYTSGYIDYTVEFKNWNGDILSTQTYHYGDKIVVPADPTREADRTYTYAFVGWDKDVVDCAANVVYTAVFEPTYIDYTVVFKNWDDEIISSKIYHYGDIVTAPEDPTREADNYYAYTFSGWDKDVVDCVGYAVYTAVFEPTYIDYTVVFENWDGEIISSKTYHYGEVVTVPEDPAREADNTYTYAFAGWDKDVMNCNSDVVYTATFKPAYIDYAVVFKNWDGEIISYQTYHYGDMVTAPADPTREADDYYVYTFSKWDIDVTTCTGDTECKAVFDAEHYHTYTKRVTKRTCTKQGYTTYSCACGNAYKADYVKATGHKYTNACDKSCNTCKATRTSPHSYKTVTKAATASANGYTIKRCSICKKETGKTTIYKVSKVSLSKTSYTYNGKVQKPSVVVKDSKGKTISSKYYTVTYASGRKNVGTYKVTIKFKGKYSGSKTITFKILPTKTCICAHAASRKRVTIDWEKRTSQVTGYQIQYSTSKKFTSAKTKILTSYKKTSLTLTTLKANTTYYFRVRTYKTVGSKKVYSGWSTVWRLKTI